MIFSMQLFMYPYKQLQEYIVIQAQIDGFVDRYVVLLIGMPITSKVPLNIFLGFLVFSPGYTIQCMLH